LIITLLGIPIYYLAVANKKAGPVQNLKIAVQQPEEV
jgi:hypothetical protein